MKTKLSSFLYELPEKFIAKYPADVRDESKLMVVHKDSGKIEHKVFKDVIDYFEEDDTLIFNNTKVFPARLFGKKEKTGAQIEVFLLRELNKESRLWDVLVDPARKIRVGNKLFFTNPANPEEDLLIAEVVDNTTSRGRTIRFFFEGTDEEYHAILRMLGNTPIPKYINREPEAIDTERYQTVYADKVGAVAAPTAGLHFTKTLLKRLEIKGVHLPKITLHVGLGTFREIEVEDLSKHKMDSEELIIDEKATEIVNSAKERKQRICAVGTTAMRGLESAVSSHKTLNTYEGWTNKFIFPPYEFSLATCMVTNFHLPKSTLMMMVSAFAGHDLMKKAYKEAILEGYKFYSYGDAMLIL